MIEWVVTEITCMEKLSEIVLGESLHVTLAHLDVLDGIDAMAIGTTFEVA